MNTEDFVLLEDTKFTEENVISLEDDKINILFWYIELCRQLIECNDLFHVYTYSLEKLTSSYHIYYDGSFKSTTEINYDDFICINTLVSGVLSSANNLISSLELTEKIFSEFFVDKETKLKEDYISRVYDKSFSYRFCYFLRNFSQHGHLTVSYDTGNKFCFNIERILYTRHFNISKKIGDELIKIRDEIYEKYNKISKISIVGTLISYNKDISEIYKSFYNFFEDLYIFLIREVDNIIKDEYLVVLGQDKYFLFYDRDKNIRAIHICPNPTNEFNKYKIEAKKYFKEAKYKKNKFFEAINKK